MKSTACLLSIDNGPAVFRIDVGTVMLANGPTAGEVPRIAFHSELSRSGLHHRTYLSKNYLLLEPAGALSPP